MNELKDGQQMNATEGKVGFRQVTKEEFYSFIMSTKLNVHPFIQNDRWSNEYGYLNHWKVLPWERDVVGISDDCNGGRYWLRD
jgi:hypothetical protein